MALKRKEAMKFAKIMLARGVLRRRMRGMMGRLARLSTYMHAGKQMANIQSEEMMNGWDPGGVSAVYQSRSIPKNTESIGDRLTRKDITPKILQCQFPSSAYNFSFTRPSNKSTRDNHSPAPKSETWSTRSIALSPQSRIRAGLAKVSAFLAHFASPDLPACSRTRQPDT